MEKHGKLIIKQINQKYDTEKAVRNVLLYIVRLKDSEDEEVRYWRAFGASGKNIKKVIQQFIKVQKAAGKTNRKRIRHMVLSLPGYMDDANIARIIAEAVSAFIYREYQVVYAVHEKPGDLHIHFAFNPVSYRTHYKWHMSSIEFKKWKKDIWEIVNLCMSENGYKICEM